MPVEFLQQEPSGGSDTRLAMAYDGPGRRISKTRMKKTAPDSDWYIDFVTHYTGIGTEIRVGGGNDNGTKIVVPMPQGMGRYRIEQAEYPAEGIPFFEWYLKNHLGSTMEVYRTTGTTAGPPELLLAYDYRSYGEQIDLTVSTDKVSENFTGKELDDETDLGYWGARYLDLMLGGWISVDSKRQFASPYLYAGNGYNPLNGRDSDGKYFVYKGEKTQSVVDKYYKHLPKEQKKRFDQLQKSRFRYEIGKLDEVYPDPDFDDDEHFLGGLAWPTTMTENGKTEVGGRAVFISARYFLHEVLQHLFDIDNQLKKNGGDVQKTTEEYEKNKQEWEDRAFENEEVEMPGIDVDEI